MLRVQYTFNCGSMELVGKTVTADKRKGKAVLSMEDDGLLRFQWRLRHSDNNEQQYFLFPAGATWTKVSECKDGRVFLLKFKDSEVRRFFWMQEPTSTAAKKDAEVLKRVSALIASPPKFGAPIPKEQEEEESKEPEDVAMVDASGVAGSSGSIESRASGETATVQGTDTPATNPNAANQEHRGAILTPPPAAAAATAAAAPAAAAAAASSSAPAAAAAAGAAGAGGALNANSLLSTLNAMAQQLQARQEAEAGAGVEDVLDASRVQPLLDVDAGLVDALVEFLPEGQRSPESLRAQLRSPQMQQTMSRLTSILNSAQFGQLMASLSLPATGGLGVDAFLKAIQEQAKKQQDDKGAK